MKALNREQTVIVIIAMILISAIFLGVMFSHPRPWREDTLAAWIFYIIVMAAGFCFIYRKPARPRPLEYPVPKEE